MAEQLRVTQQGAEAVIVDEAEARVTQQGADVAVKDSTPAEDRITQQGAESVVLKEPSPLRITAQGLDIVLKPLPDVPEEECIPVDARIITTPLNDETLRPQFLGHKMILEVTESPLSVNEDDAVWSIMESGYCTRSTLQDALTWEFAIGDTDRVEREAKLFAGPDLIVGQPSAIFGGPVVGGFGELQDRGTPLFRVSAVEAEDFITLEYVQGPTPLSELGLLSLSNSSYINQIALPFAEISDRYREFDRSHIYPNIVVEFYDPESGDLIASSFGAVREVVGQFTPISKRIPVRSRGLLPSQRIDDRLIDGDEFTVDWGASQPSVGTRFLVYMYVTQATELTPFHLDGHPVDLAIQVYDPLGIPYDQESADNTKALLGPSLRILLRPTSSETALEVLENYLHGPAGFAYRVVEGVRHFYPTRYRDSATPSETLTLASLRGEGTPYDLSDQNIITRVIWEEVVFLLWENTEDTPLDSRPLDGLLPRERNTPFTQADSNAALNMGEQIYSYPGYIPEPFPVSLSLRNSFKQRVAEEIFFRWGRGGADVTLPCLRGFEALVGEFVVNELNYSPIPEAGQLLITVRPKDYPSRRPRQVLQVVKRSESPAGPDITFQVVGPVAADVEDATGFLVVPTITIAASVSAPNNVAVVTVTNWSAIVLVSGNRVEMQWATASSEPVQWNTAGSLFGGTAGAIGTPLLPAGSHVWARARTWNTDGRFSEWSTVVDIQLDALDPPTSFVGTRIEDTLAFVFTWVNGEPTEPLVIRFAKSLDQEWTEIGSLPAGTTRFDYAFEEANTIYRVEIFHRQLLPVLSESPHVETQVTTGTTIPTLDAPLNPEATTGGGNAMLCVDVGDLNADQTVFQYAAEQSDGTFGAWVTYAILSHSGTTVCGTVSVPQETSVFDPARNRFYQLQAYHTALGYVDSDPTDAITVDPWTLAGPSDSTPVSLISDNGDTLIIDSGDPLYGEV
jgi:hypothetical protein